MVDFAQSVNAPGAASYTPPKVDSSWISNLYDNFVQGQTDIQKKKQNDQSIELNQQAIQQGQQQAQLAKAFPNGLPRTPDGGVDYAAVASTMAKFGNIGGAVNVMGQQPPPMSPLLSGGGAPQPQGGGQPGAPQGQPASIPAKPLPPPAANSPQGDAGQGTVTSMVTDKLPAQNQTTGQVISKVAQAMGVDPNQDLTPGQQRRAQGLLRQYAPDIAGAGGSGNLPPSAAAASPAPPPAPPPAAPQQGAPNGAGSPQPQQPAQPQPGAPPAPAPQQQQQQPQPQGNPPGPIGPQVPLPNGFTDPQKAILALRSEAARVGQNPRGTAQAQALDNWASRIEESVKPIGVNSMTTLVDPRTGKTVFQGPGAAAMNQTSGGSPTLDADADLYRQTGKLPPNMGRGIQGNLEARRIRERAAEQEIAEGGNPAEWSTRWQSFGAQATGRRILEGRAANLKLAENEATSLLPRVREASAKVSRTEYPTLNKLIEAGQQGRGGTEVVKFGIAVASLIPVYARVLKPVGQITEGDTHRALEILDKAWGDGQINAALDQMQVELKAARSSLDKTMDEYAGKKGDSPAKTAASTDKASKPDSEGWTTLPNGARIREVKP